MGYFNLNEYQTVEERIHLFWEKFPSGRIVNTIMFDDGERVVVKAEVFTDRADANPTTVDFAEEIKAAKGVNADSRIENCTTSATGRALSLLGGEFSPKGKRPSQQEMAKVQRRQEARSAAKPTTPQSADGDERQSLVDRLNALPDDVRKDAKERFLFQFGKPSEVKDDLLAEAAEFVTRCEVDSPF